MFKNKFISFEGLSGVGKSTISKLFADRSGASLVDTIPQSFVGLRKIIDAETTSIHARFLFYMAAVLEGESSLKIALCSGGNVVVESYLYQTIAFHRGMGSDIKITIPKDILLPDIVFYLTCKENERQRRKSKRGKRETYWDRLAERNTDKIVQEYKKFEMVSIDTTNLKPEQVVNEVLNHLNGKWI